MKLHLDFETRSAVDIKKCGAWAYASHPSTDIICMGFAVDEESVRVWTRDQIAKPPHRFAPIGYEVIPKGEVIVAHNVQFEYAIWHFILHRRYGWPALLEPSRWDCTMARALACGLPASLEGLAYSLNLQFRKDLEGRAALMKVCRPQKDGSFNQDPALYHAVYKYNALDVEVERAADKALPELPSAERKIFEADLIVNRRGLAIDLRSAAQAAAVAEELTADLNGELKRVTGGAVEKATRVQAMKAWIAAQGVAVPIREEIDEETGRPIGKETLDIEAVKDLLKRPDLPPVVRAAVILRQQVGKSSTAKFRSMLECACADGRVRGAFQYHGGHTGRWAGRLIQPQNFPQGFAFESEVEECLEALTGGPFLFKSRYDGGSMQALSDSLRGMIVPAPGKAFVGADLNAIEARVLFWLAGELEMLKLYAKGESPYVTMARRIYGREDISKKETPREYDIGKRSTLGCGFGMGWRRFQANVYTETGKRGEPVEISEDLARKAVKAYRDSCRNVVRFWYDTEAAATRAVLSPGSTHWTSNRVAWAMSPDRRFLCCKLPSGRLLRYYRPSVRAEENKVTGDVKNILYYWTAAGKGAIKTECNGFLGLYKTWGGELVENVVQATARDILAHGLLAAEMHHLPVVLHAHDELLVEMAEKAVTEDTLGWLVDCMTKGLPAWAAGLPVAAEGWTGRRYRK